MNLNWVRFKLAISNQVPIIPLVQQIINNKYPENNLKLSLGIFRVLIHKPINTIGMTSSNCHELKCQLLILKKSNFNKFHEYKKNSDYFRVPKVIKK